MALRHWQHYIDECPNARGFDDRSVTEEMAVNCLQCLRRMAAGSSLSDDSESSDEYDNPYLIGYCDGKEAAYAEVLAHLDDDSHDVNCTCDQCGLVNHVLVSTLRRFQEGLRSDVWIRMHRN